MSLSVLVSSNPVTILETTPKIGLAANQRKTCTFTIHDPTGTALYKKGQPVSVNDSNLGVLYAGYLNNPVAQNYVPNPDNVWACDCVDMVWLADKRSSNAIYTNQYSGVIVADQVQNILASEGVTGNVALDYNHAQTDWSAGGATMTNVTATDNAGDGNVGDGDLELALAGTQATHTDNTTTLFNLGTATNIDTANNQLQLTSYSGLSYAATADSGYGSNLYAYQKIWAGSYTIQSGDELVYSVWVNSGSPQIMAGVDGVCSDGTTIRDFNSQELVDQNGLAAHPGTDLSGFANDQWYFRKISLTPIAGKSLSFAQLGFEGDTAGQYQAYFYNIAIMNGGSTNLVIYTSSANPTSAANPQVNAKVSDYGYSAVALAGVIVYLQNGTWTSASGNSAAAAGIHQSSQVFWSVQNTTTTNGVTQTTSSPANSPPTNTSVSVSTSFDGLYTWQVVANEYDPIGNLPVGATLTGMAISTQIVLAITGKDPTVTPVVTAITWIIYPSYAMTKTDITGLFGGSTDFSNGVFSQTEWQTWTMLPGLGYVNGLAPVSFQRTWDDDSLSNQTLYGTGSSAQLSYLRELRLSNDATGGACDTRSRFDFAGNLWADFITQIDIVVPAVGCNVGLNYRTTNWNNNNNTFAYSAYISSDSATQTTLVLGYGSNSGSSGSFHTVGSYTFPQVLTIGSVHTLTISAIGSAHALSVDGVLLLNAIDGTYTGAGYLGARLYNNSGGAHTGNFDNFGVIASNGVYAPFTSYSGPTWTSNTIALGSMTVGESLIQWNDVALSSGDYLNVQASVNGGAYAPCFNGQPIPGLSAGTVLSSATLTILVWMQGSSPVDVPVLSGLTVYVMPKFSSTGTWISPALSLSNVGRAANSLVNWNVVLPDSSTTLTVKTSVDGGSTYQTIAAAGDPIPNITTQPSPTIDTFGTNTSANYTSTHGSGGTLTTWTWNTALSQLQAVGGNKGLLLYNALSSVGDVDLCCDLGASENGGLAWHYTSPNYYELQIKDAGVATNPNTYTLNKVSGSTVTQLATGAIVFNANTYHHVRVTMIGSVITAYFDGAQVLTYTDGSPLAAGQVGLRNNSGTSYFYQFRAQPLGENVSSVSVLTKLILTSTDPTLTPQVLDVSTFVSDSSFGAGVQVPTATYQQTIVSSNIDDQNKRSNYNWTILPSKQIVFQSLSAQPAPFILQSVADPATANIQVANLQMENGGDLYRNRMTLKNVQGTINQIKVFKGDGQSTSWSLPYPVAPNTVPVIQFDGVKQTVGVKGLDTGKEFYYQVGSSSIDADSSVGTPTPVDLISVTYVGSYTTYVTEDNTGGYPGTVSQSQWAAIADDSGIVECVIDVSSMNLDIPTAQAYAQSLLQRYGVIGRILTFMTLSSGLAIGQMLPCFLTCFSMQNAQLFVTQVGITEIQVTQNGVTAPQYWYSCVATEGAALDGWAKVLGQSLVGTR